MLMRVVDKRSEVVTLAPMPLTTLLAYPRKIKSAEKAVGLPWIGGKMKSKVTRMVSLTRRELIATIDRGVPQVWSNQGNQSAF